MKKPRKYPWRWQGDDPSEQSGLWWQEDGEGLDYVNAVRIVACSDAGGPGNLYVVEEGTLYLKDAKSVLSVIGVERGHYATYRPIGRFGMPAKELDDCRRTFSSEFEARFWIAGHPEVKSIYTTFPTVERSVLVHAHLASNGIEVQSSRAIRIGPVDPFWKDGHERGWNPEPDIILRANTSLIKYVKKNYCY